MSRMFTYLAGIDEAGYGPLLGPLCVGLTVFRVEHPEELASPPNLWKLLRTAVCCEPGRSGARDKQGRIPVGDSKELKLSNSSKTVHPLVHLERAVISFAGLSGIDFSTDDHLLSHLGAAIPPHPAYATAPSALPLAMPAGEVGICRNLLRGACEKSAVTCEAVRCRVIPEPEFNDVISRTGNKAETTVHALGEHLRRLWADFASVEHNGTPSRLGIVCDRLGGRASYAGLLQRELPDTCVEVIEESPTRSRYIVTDAARRASVTFLTEGESAHLPVALASMTAKYTREILMHRFNRSFCDRFRIARGIELKPTAGYSFDARRWLDEIGEVLAPPDRECLVRRA